MNTSTSSISAAGGAVSVGHGPGVRSNEGTSPDRGTGAPDSNLTEIEPTQEPAGADNRGKDQRSSKQDRPVPGTGAKPSQPD